MKEIWRSATYKVVQAMRASGNREGLVAGWKAGLDEWAVTQPPTSEVKALQAWLPLFTVRPFYTSTELAPMLPALAAYLGHKELRPPRSAKRVENRLNFVGLPVLQNADGLDTFVNPATGRYDRYFVVERLHFWGKQTLTQEEFEREFFRCRDIG